MVQPVDSLVNPVSRPASEYRRSRRAAGWLVDREWQPDIVMDTARTTSIRVTDAWTSRSTIPSRPNTPRACVASMLSWRNTATPWPWCLQLGGLRDQRGCLPSHRGTVLRYTNAMTVDIRY